MTQDTWTLSEIVEQLEWCGYQCEGGPLEKNVAFMALKRLADRSQGRQIAFVNPPIIRPPFVVEESK